MKHLGDITKINGAEIEPVWCITGGSPCQDLSVAGKRAGLAGERSGLFMEQVRIVKEMREHDKSNGRTGDMVRPRFLVWENVPGAFSSNGGEDFRAVLEEIVRIAEPTFSVPRLEGKWTKAGAIDGDGWSIAWRTHDAQYWGVPQRRRRISLVADFGGSSAGEILFERKSLSGDSQPSQPKREETTGDSTNGIGVNDRVANSSGNDVAGTLDSSYYKGCGLRQGVEREVVAYGVDTYNQSVDNVAQPLRSADSGDTTPKVAYTPKIRGGVDKDANGKSAGKGALVQTDLSATLGATQDQTLFQPMCIGNVQVDQLKMSDKVGALNCMHDQQAVCLCEPIPMTMQAIGEYKNCDVASSCKMRDYKDATDLICEPVNYSEKLFFDWEEDDKSVTLRNKGGSYGNGSEVLHREPYQTTVGALCMDDYKGTNRQYVEQDKCVVELTLYDMTHANDVIGDCGGTSPTLQNRMGTGGNQVPVTVQKGLFYGKESNTEGIKALQTLWKDYGEKEVLQWGTSILERLQQADVLRQRMHEESIPLEGTQGNIVDDNSLPCEELVAEWILRDVRKQQECGCPSQRRKSAEQFLGESSEIVPELPHQSTQTSKDLLDMWSKGEGVWILRQALSEIQKMGESSCGKTKWIRWIVRRLTPLEAERLQGYPDGWTDIGEWVDSKGKKHKEADSPRYKALGNSIALPFWYWMFCRMAKYLPEDATLGSLFDGIGGFPLCWENIHGKGTARWASEIEEYPIAVTKIRFGGD